MTDLTKPGESSLAIVSMEDAKKLVVDTLEATGAQAFDLPRIKVPSAGSSLWMINTPEGVKGVESFRAVIASSVGNQRAFWMSDVPSGSFPDCSSDDGVTGTGKRGPKDTEDSAQECATCIWNQKGTGKTEFGRKCTESIYLFLFLEGNIMPHLLVVPPASLKLVRNYSLQVAGMMKRPHEVMTTFGLESGSASIPGEGEVKFNKIRPSIDRPLTDHEVKELADLVIRIKGLSTKDIEVTQEEVS